ncbi:MAG: hypothetical protein KGI52_10785, partial [Burkholderiales bacterium]|nr:hypothetical protein [Burkholderiales bacterium]
VKAFGQYTHIKDDTTNNKDTIYQLGVSVPVSDKVNVVASFGSLKHKLNVASTSTTDRVSLWVPTTPCLSVRACTVLS